jgi:PHAT
LISKKKFFFLSAFQILQSIKYVANIDEDSLNAFMWTIDKAIHHDAFHQQMGRLKEYKFKLQRIKIMFSTKLYGNRDKGSTLKLR